MKAILELGLALVLSLALGAPAVAAPAPVDERPRERPRESYPEDRPFTGDPGGEPPPPPVRPREPERKSPDRTDTPVRPKEPKPPVVGTKNPDLLDPRGPNIIAAGVGLAAGLTRHSTGGFQLQLGWSYQLSRMFWFDVIPGITIGGACKVVSTDPVDGRVTDSDCGSFRGVGFDLLAGIQMKLVNIRLWKVPVVPFVRAAAGVAFIIADTPNDGAAIVLRVGGGARYYFTSWFSVGGELAFTLGPAFRNHLDSGFYTKLELLAGVEFIL